MRITNVDKFRQDMFKALKDVYYSGVETCECMWKGDREHSEFMNEHFVFNDDYSEIVSLPQPLHFTEKHVAVTVGDEYVILWDTSVKTHYEVLKRICIDCYQTRMGIAMVVCRSIEELDR